MDFKKYSDLPLVDEAPENSSVIILDGYNLKRLNIDSGDYIGPVMFAIDSLVDPQELIEAPDSNTPFVQSIVAFLNSNSNVFECPSIYLNILSHQIISPVKEIMYNKYNATINFQFVIGAYSIFIRLNAGDGTNPYFSIFTEN